jgi:ribonucleotide reductase beta subunit family protein with ferritin-like domain
MLFTLRMEQGRLVDEFSSREIKRLLYMTERRIRYASAPALRDSAVYFKSGSLYSCQKEEGFKCGKYMGNKKNYMNSVAIVETVNHDRKLHYIATLISNILRVNSAVDHQTMGMRIHRLIEKANPVPPPPPELAVIDAPAEIQAEGNR